MNYYSNLTDQCAGDSRKLFRVVILCLKTLYPDALTRYLRRQISSLRRQIGHVISAMRQGLLSCRRHIGKREDPGDEVGRLPAVRLGYVTEKWIDREGPKRRRTGTRQWTCHK